MTRYVNIAHKLTGWNAIHHRASQLNLSIPPEQIRLLTAQIKEISAIKSEFDLSDCSGRRSVYLKSQPGVVVC